MTVHNQPNPFKDIQGFSEILNAPDLNAPEAKIEPNISNKKQVIAFVAAFALGALTAFIYTQRQDLYTMQNACKIVAESDFTRFSFVRSRYVENDGACLQNYTSFERDVTLPKDTSDFTDLHETIKNVYNEATSNGTDLLSRFGYYARRFPVMEFNENVTYKFRICRSNIISSLPTNTVNSISNLKDLFFAPWTT